MKRLIAWILRRPLVYIEVPQWTTLDECHTWQIQTRIAWHGCGCLFANAAYPFDDDHKIRLLPKGEVKASRDFHGIRWFVGNAAAGYYWKGCE